MPEKVMLNIYQKIANVMKDVEYLQKDDAIEFKSTRYKAISEEKVTMAVRTSMLKHGLVIIPIEQEHTRVDSLTTVNVRYRIQNIDNQADYIIATSSGTGADTQDKGVGKAMTYSYKYLLLRTFAIPTGEDPDKISSEELDEKLKQQEKANNQKYEKLLEAVKKAGFTEDSMIKQVTTRYKKHPRDLDTKEYDAVLKGFLAAAK